MKVLLLAGGYGTRLSEETGLRPKPMVEIGDKPILWHIMKTYSSFGYNEFIILMGYKGSIIKDYFINYFMHQNDCTLDTSNNQITYHNKKTENWKITFLDTGMDTMTGGRVKRAESYIDGPFMLTYGDGVSNVNIDDLVKFHKASKKLITLTSVIPEGRFGRLEIQSDNSISQFIEKPKEENWINGGFFVCEPEVLNYINNGDQTIFEKEPLENLAKDHQLVAFKHHGFWKCMDSLNDKNNLDNLWNHDPKWKVW